MLYVFHVDAGKMLTFDMCTAVESVQNLKEQIEQQHKIPATNQVLLVSGGEMLDLCNRVCSYSAGTDTNPIFMFSTILDPSNPPQPWPSIESAADPVDMKEKVEQCLQLPAIYQTVVKRNQVAQQFDELAKIELATCEKLVHEQHLQQQGWAAVVANLEDLTAEFKERCQFFDRVFTEMVEKRDYNLNCLATFNEDLEKLASIPILAPLTQNAAKPFHAFDDIYKADSSTESGGSKQAKSNDSSSSLRSLEGDNVQNPKMQKNRGSMRRNKNSRDDKELAAVVPEEAEEDEEEVAAVEEEGKTMDVKAVTLLEWIARNENQISLRKMADQCVQSFQKINVKDIDVLKADAQHTIMAADKEDMKAIKGLEDRLCGLESLMQEAKICVKEQNELAQGFQQNQNRVNNLGDASILPDLCASHGKQLTVMFTNHKKLRNIRSRISKAKAELRANLLQRLKYVIFLENKMHDLNVKWMFHNLNCGRLHRHMSIIEQIHQAPTVYVTAVSEVVRRRNFSSAFLTWASDLSRHLVTIYEDECMKRTEFKTLFEGHFLSTLFPGMDDMPPEYAIKEPPTFDASLPTLTMDDLAVLTMKIPDVVSKFELPDLSAVIEFFQSRSGSQRGGQTGEERQSSTNTSNVMIAGGSGSVGSDPVAVINKLLDIHPHLKEYEKGFESETDTEEFERVGQSPVDRRRTSDAGQAYKTLTSSTQTSLDQFLSCRRPDTASTSTSTEAVQMINNETLTEENLATTTLEVERLRRLLNELSTLSRDSIGLLKKQLADLKTESITNKSLVTDEFEKINSAWLLVQEQTDSQTQQLIKQTMDHELEMNDMRQNLESRSNEIQVLKCDKEAKERECVKLKEGYEVEKRQLEATTAAVDHQRLDLQTRLDEMVAEKDRIIKETTDKLNRDYNSKVETLRSRLKLMTSMERSPSDTSLEKIERHDLLEMSGIESVLSQSQIKGAIGIRSSPRGDFSGSPSTLVSCSPRSPSSSSAKDLYRRVLEEKENQMDNLRCHIDQLAKDNDRYKQTIIELTDNLHRDYDMMHKLEAKERELEEERQKRIQMETSVAVFAKMDASQVTSTTSTAEKPPSEPTRKETIISVNSCSVGSYVLVVWNSIHNHYVILQDSPILFFLHCSSYEPLRLPQLSNNTVPMTTYCIGKVEHKEFCVARKDENRYKVAKGTKFYRVKVRPKSKESRSSKTNLLSRIASTDKCDMSTSTTTVTQLSTIAASPTTASTQLISSFAQTEMGQVEEVGTDSKDMIDSGLEATSIYKERNISVTEEDDRVVMGVDVAEGDHKQRYLSVSEEDDIAGESNQNEVLIMIEDDDEDGRRLTNSRRKFNVGHIESDQDDSADEYRSLESKDGAF